VNAERRADLNRTSFISDSLSYDRYVHASHLIVWISTRHLSRHCPRRWRASRKAPAKWPMPWTTSQALCTISISSLLILQCCNALVAAKTALAAKESAVRCTIGLFATRLGPAHRSSSSKVQSRVFSNVPLNSPKAPRNAFRLIQSSPHPPHPNLAAPSTQSREPGPPFHLLHPHDMDPMRRPLANRRHRALELIHHWGLPSLQQSMIIYTLQILCRSSSQTPHRSSSQSFGEGLK
jgi:hypothetical protein